MLKTVLLLGVFLLIVGSQIVIQDWDNEEPVKILNDLDSEYEYFNPEDLQCLDKSNKKELYQEKEMMPCVEISNG